MTATSETSSRDELHWASSQEVALHEKSLLNNFPLIDNTLIMCITFTFMFIAKNITLLDCKSILWMIVKELELL